jgi:hypothetical protein
MFKIKTMSVYLDGYDWRQASFAGIGKNVVAELLFRPKDSLFQVGFDPWTSDFYDCYTNPSHSRL